ncbi:MAG TPA: sel1 repeat family protein, partial [Verrucomicrobiae bacterium]|nr:sel1 repeat family protein [Verrucomicrobiae bacterium]
AFANGSGVEKDPVEAYKWYSLAAAAGDRDADLAQRELVASLTPAQLAEGLRRVSEIRRRLPAKVAEAPTMEGEPGADKASNPGDSLKNPQ